MHFAVLALIAKEDAQRLADVKAAVDDIIGNLDDQFFESRKISRFEQWVIGGRYAADSPDAEQIVLSPELAFVKQGLEVEGVRMIEPEEQSIFGDKVMIPVAELTDGQVEQFDLAVMYRESTEEERAEASLAKSRAEARRALYPDDFAVIVHAFDMTAVERNIVRMSDVFSKADSVTIWKIRNKEIVDE